MTKADQKIILVTGATDGIGKETARILAGMGMKVVIHGRSRENALAASDTISEETANASVDHCFGDFASLPEVREMAASIERKYDRLDVLINNAGIFEKVRKTSHDGYELTFTVNHLAPFLLTGLLLPMIRRSADGRIINVASMAHASSIDFRDLQLEKHYEGYKAYSLSKLCNVMFTFELAERMKGTGITANCLHPGVIRTKLLREGFGMGGASLASGAETPVWLAVSDEIKGVSGRYYVNKNERRPAAFAYDKKARERLWAESERLTGISFK